MRFTEDDLKDLVRKRIADAGFKELEVTRMDFKWDIYSEGHGGFVRALEVTVCIKEESFGDDEEDMIGKEWR